MTALNKPNVVLIGMPGSGKTTVGQWLARQLNYDFIDGDALIEQAAGMTIQQVVNRLGLKRFAEYEERALCELSDSHAVISTGGSAVYSEKAMRHLAQNAVMVYLKISARSLVQRVDNATSRGLHKLPAHPLLRVFHERVDLYPKYADITFANDAPFTALRGAILLEQLAKFPDNGERIA